jgi:predicted polyphosphate/ATP-dependent NAD kinase
VPIFCAPLFWVYECYSSGRQGSLDTAAEPAGTDVAVFGDMTTSAPLSVGVIANPSSGRDMRRLLAWASVFPTAEKINVMLRLLSAMGRMGVAQAWMIPDAAGMAMRVSEAAELARSQRGLPMPLLRLLDMPVRDNALDSAVATQLMVQHGVRLIAVLGGDGTHRAVAAHCGRVPLATLSTGTNNAFPELREATLVGMASALVASGRVPEAVGLRANKRLRITGAGVNEMALVDVALSRQLGTGGRAVWQGDELSDLYTTFAEANAIGLSSIAGLAHPVARSDAFGMHLQLGAGRSLWAPILPGVLQQVSIAGAALLLPRQPVALPAMLGTVALDGERELEIDASDRLHIELDFDGPRTVAVEAALAHAAREGLMFD